MKKVIALFAFILLIGAPYNTSAEVKPFLWVKLVIDSHTTQEDLTSMQNFMTANGYTLKIKEVRFDETGHVQEIDADVDFGKDRSCSFSTIDKTGDGAIRIEVTKTLLGDFGIETFSE